MSSLYKVAMISKQAIHQFNRRQTELSGQHGKVIDLAVAIRKKHPGMGCRAMYGLMGDVGMGRDKVENLLLETGFNIKRKKNPIKTTQSQRHLLFSNLINGLSLQGINMVWQTDITYLIRERQVFYLIFIVDVYSRRILGYKANDHMRAEANVACLKMAFRARIGHSLVNLIHHSDYGGQHIAKPYLTALKSRKIKISMARTALENAYTERINGTIKNDYLAYRKIDNLPSLRWHLARDVQAYNAERPHQSLPSRMSPIAFENYIASNPINKLPKLQLYDHSQNQDGVRSAHHVISWETLFSFP